MVYLKKFETKDWWFLCIFYDSELSKHARNIFKMAGCLAVKFILDQWGLQVSLWFMSGFFFLGFLFG